MNSLHDNFHGAGESTTDLSHGIVRGKIPGGVAILWHKKLDSVISVVRLESECCIGIQIKCYNKEFIILNIYTPYESRHNDNCVNRLAFISSFISDQQCTSMYVDGDWNADISDNASCCHKHMVRFSNDNIDY